MKRFEMKSNDPDRYFIDMIDAKIGDIMYIRQSGKIVAVKLLSAIADVDRDGYFVGSVLLLDAENKVEHHELVSSLHLYRSVEDCRKGENEIGNIELDPLLVAESAGFSDFELKNGIPVFHLYKWDEYYPRQVKLDMREMEFTFCGESWMCNSIYYRTFEECEADNHVEIIRFPEQ